MRLRSLSLKQLPIRMQRQWRKKSTSSLGAERGTQRSEVLLHSKASLMSQLSQPTPHPTDIYPFPLQPSCIISSRFMPRLFPLISALHARASHISDLFNTSLFVYPLCAVPKHGNRILKTSTNMVYDNMFGGIQNDSMDQRTCYMCVAPSSM